MRKKNKVIVWLFGLGVIGIAFWSISRHSTQSQVYCSGRIQLDPKLVTKASSIRTLFLVLHDASSTSPMPYGAQKLTLTKAPGELVTHFILTQDNVQVMQPNMPAPKTLTLKARLDLDGTGGKDKPGDLTGSLASIPLGSRDLVVTINSRITPMKKG